MIISITSCIHVCISMHVPVHTCLEASGQYWVFSIYLFLFSFLRMCCIYVSVYVCMNTCRNLGWPEEGAGSSGAGERAVVRHDAGAQQHTCCTSSEHSQWLSQLSSSPFSVYFLKFIFIVFYLTFWDKIGLTVWARLAGQLVPSGCLSPPCWLQHWGYSVNRCAHIM